MNPDGPLKTLSKEVENNGHSNTLGQGPITAEWPMDEKRKATVIDLDKFLLF